VEAEYKNGSPSYRYCLVKQNALNFINIPRRPNRNSRDTPISNKAAKDLGNESDLDNKSEFDKEVNAGTINDTINENIKTKN
jgi:hypothetical protein